MTHDQAGSRVEGTTAQARYLYWSTWETFRGSSQLGTRTKGNWNWQSVIVLCLFLEEHKMEDSALIWKVWSRSTVQTLDKYGDPCHDCKPCVVRKFKVLLYERTPVGKTAEKFPVWNVQKVRTQHSGASRITKPQPSQNQRLEIDVQGIDNPMIRKQAWDACKHYPQSVIGELKQAVAFLLTIWLCNKFPHLTPSAHHVEVSFLHHCLNYVRFCGITWWLFRSS